MTADDTQPNDPAGSSHTSNTAAPIGRTEGSARIAPRSARARLEPERMPQVNRPSRRARHPVVIAGNAIFTIILLIAIGAGVVFGVGKQRFDAPGPLPQEKVVNIPRGGVTDVADLLLREGVIDQKWLFVGSVFVLQKRDDLKSGEYAFGKSASLRNVIDTMVEGKVVQHQLTVPEGLTSEQVVARLLENPILTGTLKEIPREGTLLPDSYRFTRGDTREQVVQRMQQAQRRVVQDVWERRSAELPINSPEQLVTLASIIEKETGRSDERTRVAAVFVNRLKQRMRLQSDPTIIYGLVGGKGTLGRGILRSEIEQPTPYNTYVIPGLPPGPIANPGRASIEAAANPSRTKEIFFVADGTGGHAFAETLADHQRNVARWRQLEREGGRGQATDAAPADAVPTATPATAPAAAPAAPAAAPAQAPAQRTRPQNGGRTGSTNRQ